jgi:peptide-methionine (S)-S-oxide reductase
MENKNNKKLKEVVFAAGCFWGVEEAFRNLGGVAETEVGYTGGHLDNPTYENVCSGKTGHAEAVRVVYDPEKISYEKLVEFFWDMHDPTTFHRQPARHADASHAGGGPDVGEQYRSAIFYSTPEEKQIAEESKKELEASGKLKNPVVTEIVPASRFWRAEEYHQKYFEKKGGTATCHI